MSAAKPEKIGFIGLGQMGGPMATNIAKGGFDLSVYDKAGTQERAPEDTQIIGDTAALARATDTIFVSVPDGKASLAVVDEIVAATDRRVKVVIDLSTIGPAAAREAAKRCKAAGIVYMDAPVSGGRGGAIAGTIAVMLAGPKAIKEAHDDVLKSFAKNPFHVGEEAGQGQALKILNNYLSGTALAATTEAMLYGLSQGLDLKTMLDVVNVSTGRNTATEEKFPNRVLTGTFKGGFAAALLSKDINLFLENAHGAGTPTRIADTVGAVWDDTNEKLPGADIMAIYLLMRDGKVEGY
jgi:3-hydroxyisobutyrate dehydrogenase